MACDNRTTRRFPASARLTTGGRWSALGVLRERRAGLTLVELLVTIAIVLTISAVALPLLAPRGEGRRQREAARQVTSFFTGARARAAELGRPAGVWIEGLAGDHENIAALSYCEIPPSYSGETLNSKFTVVIDTGTGIPHVVQLIHEQANVDSAGNLQMVYTPIPGPYLLVQRGDLIQFGHHSTLYRITGGRIDPDDPNGRLLMPPDIASDPTTVWQIEVGIGQPPPPQGNLPFIIHRAPIKSAAQTLELPAGTVFNLDFSGDDLLPLHPVVDEAGASFWVSTGGGWRDGSHEPHEWVEDRLDNFHEPFVILFAPNGSVDSIYRFKPAVLTATPPPPTQVETNDPSAANSVMLVREPPTGPLYLLLGKSENALEGGSPEDQFRDLLDPDNQWIAVDPATGMARSVEINVPSDGTPQLELLRAQLAGDDLEELEYRPMLQLSRRFLIDAQGRGGQ